MLCTKLKHLLLLKIFLAGVCLMRNLIVTIFDWCTPECSTSHCLIVSEQVCWVVGLSCNLVVNAPFSFLAVVEGEAMEVTSTAEDPEIGRAHV